MSILKIILKSVLIITIFTAPNAYAAASEIFAFGLCCNSLGLLVNSIAIFLSANKIVEMEKKLEQVVIAQQKNTKKMNKHPDNICQTRNKELSERVAKMELLLNKKGMLQNIME